MVLRHLRVSIPEANFTERNLIVGPNMNMLSRSMMGIGHGIAALLTFLKNATQI